MTRQQTPRDPMAIMERAMQAGTLAGLDLPRGTIRTALDLGGDFLDQSALAFGRAGAVLPRGQLQAGLLSRRRYLGQEDLVTQTARGLSLCSFLAADTQVPAAQLSDLVAREDAYRGFSLLGGRIATFGMDLRAVYGAYLWYLIDETLTYLEGRFSDPALPRAEEELLLDQFGPALLLIDEALRKPLESKTVYAQVRGELGDQLREAEAEAALAEAELAVKHDLPASRTALLAAARRHFQKLGQKLGQAPAGPPEPPQVPEPEGRRIIR